MNNARVSDLARIAETITGNVMVYYVVYRLLEEIHTVINFLLTNELP